ncbi:class I SAM-dependent methyltransferase [Nocardia camponoti]|uniref:Transferase n=1 Tax=Nocardia camponoti TaxID=1616106 RepID=A0A917V413_9NOCA|nr:methyltransferase domain-containing protein [Nocardia camponoti]GGK33549.1 transferase [Nocardia camponoti]
MTRTCRACPSTDLTVLLDLGAAPAADYFPPADEPVAASEVGHPLRMDRCATCGLAQLADDDTVTSEPRGVEPLALREQATDAVKRVAAAGLLDGATVREFGSPHGGTWVPLLTARGFTQDDNSPADVVLDCFGIMHEPDQRAAFAHRAAATSDTGVLLLQYHSLATIVRDGQWNALRHGHFAYYTLEAVRKSLAAVGMSIVRAWEFDLYGGTVLLAARHGDHPAHASVERVDQAERAALTPQALAGFGDSVTGHVTALREWLNAQRGQRVYAYGAASRAVALFALAGANTSLLTAVADASPAKAGRRMPGTDVPIITPTELVAANPDAVLLTLPDLLAEVSTALPGLDGRWVVDDPTGPITVSAANDPNRVG